MPDMPSTSTVARRASSRYAVSIVDHRGQRRACSVNIPAAATFTAAALATLRTAIGSITNGAVVATTLSSSEEVVNTTLTTTYDESYSTIDHVAVLHYQDTAGNVITVEVPAPDLSIFYADGVTVDPTKITGINSAVSGVINAGDPAGTYAFVRGYLSTRRGERASQRVRPGTIREPAGTDTPPVAPGV